MSMYYRKSESGYIMIEAATTMIIFMAALLLLINMTRVFTVHNKIQFAINSAANNIAAYSYLYTISGAQAGVNQLKADGESYMEKLNTVTGFLKETSAAVAAFRSGEKTSVDYDEVVAWKGNLEDAVDAAKNPKDLAIGIMYTLVLKGEQKLADESMKLIARPITKGYLKQGDMSADDYLKSMGIEGGLDFSGSHYLADPNQKIVDIVVTYEIEMPYFKFFKLDPKLKVVNRATACAWLDGDGSHD